jgi:acetyltransferase
MSVAPDPISLKPFFNPSSVALVGATEDLTKFGGRCLAQMIEFGYRGRVLPVNPRRTTLRGLPCYPSVTELPETPDHVGIVIGAENVLPVLKECAAKGVRFATVFTSDFSETGTERGRALQDEIRAFARGNGIRFMGPNCNGLVNFVDGFAMVSTAAIRGPRRPAGNVGLICHSGGLGHVNIMWRAQEAGVGITYEVSCGNEADLDTADFLRFMIEDPATDCVMMALETIRDAGRFAAAAQRAVELGKPVVVLKFGRTEAGRRAAASHTGAVTGADEVYDAAFRRLGVIRVNDCNELYEVAKLLRRRKWPKGNRAAAVSGSGGHSVLMADLGAAAGIEWTPYGEATHARLRELMPGFAAVSNPTDLTSALTGSRTLFSDALHAIAGDERVDFMIPILVSPTVAATEDVFKLAAESAKPVAVLWTGFCPENPAITAATLSARGLPVYRDAKTCLKAVRAAMDYAAFLERRGSDRPAASPDTTAAKHARERLAVAGDALTERAAKEVLTAYGFDVTREHLAQSAEDAIAFAGRTGGKVALKIQSPDILHKTEAGAIRLGVEGADAVGRAYAEVVAAAKRYKPGARIEGVLVQEMVPSGVELMLGITADPAFGPVLVAGLGGIHVEVLRDVACRLPPVTREEARTMLKELKAYPLLEGVRGSPPRDIDAVCGAIARLSQLALDLGAEVQELDINPLVALERGAGARVVDALIVRKTP